MGKRHESRLLLSLSWESSLLFCCRKAGTLYVANLLFLATRNVFPSRPVI
jgi:hypothetical protein